MNNDTYTSPNGTVYTIHETDLGPLNVAQIEALGFHIPEGLDALMQDPERKKQLCDFLTDAYRNYRI